MDLDNVGTDDHEDEYDRSSKRIRLTDEAFSSCIDVRVSRSTPVSELYEIMHAKLYECFKHYNLKHYDIGLWNVCEYLVATVPANINLCVEIDVRASCVVIRF